MDKDGERPTQLSSGQMVGHYRIESWVGEGAMGVVYRAVDTHLDRPVAIKVLRPESIADEERRKRFVQEAKAASALNHPNIITIYDIGTVGPKEQPIDFIAMEYVEGQTLSHRIGRRGLKWDEAVKYAVQIADALATAQAAGLVHRDLKPANVMITAQDRVKVLDFGLAKLTEPVEGQRRETDRLTPTETEKLREGPLTEKGAIVGTVAYMSPEQAEGKSVDGRSDIFSFGSLVYEMLTGEWPFQGDSRLAILAAILREEPKPLSAIVEGVPRDLERVLYRCLRKDRARRFQYMADVKVALEELREESDSDHLAVDGGARQVRGRRWLGARAWLILAVAAVAVWLGWSRASDWLASRRLPVEKLLVVLPFQNVGDDPANETFCDGLTETLASKLTQLEQFQSSLRVVPASEVRRERIAGAREARQSFGASLVVTGSVRRSEGRVSITANLVDAGSLVQLRSHTVEAPVQELWRLEQDVIEAIVRMLELQLGAQARKALAQGGTTAPRAYDFYVQGRGYLHRYDRLENIDSAITLFEGALQQDPNYALAYAGLGEAYWHKHRTTRDVRWVEAARENCMRAARLNERLAPVHVTLGIIHRGTGRYPEAIQELESALRIDPVNADAYRELAGAYEAIGQIEKAEETFQRAIQLRPGSWLGYKDLAVFYYRRARYADAEKQFLAVVQLTPDNARGWSSLGAMYHLMGRYDEAERMFQKSLGIRPSPEAYTNLGTMYHFLGRHADAAPMMEKAIELGASDYQLWGNLGETYRKVPDLASRAPGAYRRGIELAEKRLSVNPEDAEVRASLASYCAKIGDRRRALVEIELARKTAPQNVNLLFRAATVYEVIGQRGRALEALSAAVKKGYSIEEIRRAGDLEELRKDPRYNHLLEARASR